MVEIEALQSRRVSCRPNTEIRQRWKGKDLDRRITHTATIHSQLIALTHFAPRIELNVV